MRSFLAYISQERRLFGYPPFAELITLRIHDESISRVDDMMGRLLHKISLIKKETTFLAFDTAIREKYR